MRPGRLALYVVLICLPTVLIVGAGGYFILTEVPRAVRRERANIGREYREMAENFIAHPEQATYVGGRMKGWRQSGRINGVAWGVETDFDKRRRLARVWFRSGEEEWRALAVDAIRPFPYEAVFYVCGCLVALSLFGLSCHSVRYMVRCMRERDDFLAAAAHDLTTPLVGLRMVIGRDDGEARRLVERMLLIVGNIKDFLKLGGRRRRPQVTRFDLVALCREAYQLFAADYAESEGGEVVFSCDAPTADIAADETMTLQILWNLFGNDLKYAAPYGKVSVCISQTGGQVSLILADEGPGMAPRQMKRAFDRYYRAQTVLASGKGGFGIGLCTAREFARAMGGDLTVCANTPQGCRFALSLPTAPRLDARR